MKELTPEIKTLCHAAALSLGAAASRPDDPDEMMLRATNATIASIFMGLVLNHDYDLTSLLREANYPEEMIPHMLAAADASMRQAAAETQSERSDGHH